MSAPKISPECNTYLDQVLEFRRSIRSFKPEIPPKEVVKSILRAGILAPYASMANDKDFCDLLGIPFGEFELNGCALGYPAVEPASASRPEVDEVTRWV